MFVVGLTGGIASGKTQVSGQLAALGARIIDTDVIVRELTAPGGKALAHIREAFGDAFFADNGELDRGALRRRIFAAPGARAQLESILHPMIRGEVARLLQVETKAPYTVLVVPLLVETGAYAGMIDYVLVVDSLPEQQRLRLMARGGLGPDEADAIIAAQTSRKNRLGQADGVIDNSGDLPGLAAQVARFHKKFVALGSTGA
jgi:dephospho-CoA kinase